MFDESMQQLARDLFEDLEREDLMIATAESCTGGLIAALLTEVPGSSAFVECGFVTYSNRAKSQLLGVPAELIERDGAVSESVARAMAEGALAHSEADIAVAVTGVAGPGGGAAAKPVGLVHVAAKWRGRVTCHERLELGDIGRDQVRLETVRQAIQLARTALAV
jgi:nicotinamide-nucleotide amidase